MLKKVCVVAVVLGLIVPVGLTSLSAGDKESESSAQATAELSRARLPFIKTEVIIAEFIDEAGDLELSSAEESTSNLLKVYEGPADENISALFEEAGNSDRLKLLHYSVITAPQQEEVSVFTATEMPGTAKVFPKGDDVFTSGVTTILCTKDTPEGIVCRVELEKKNMNL
ncbi:MAG: hypothetical protein R3C11_07930 [Planctomycetaceae bacterium]